MLYGEYNVSLSNRTFLVFVGRISIYLSIYLSIYIYILEDLCNYVSPFLKIPLLDFDQTP